MQYEDIIHLTRPQYDDFPPMDISDRAAQFSPFAALTGYDEAVAETARLVDSRIALTEDDENELNANLNFLIDTILSIADPNERPEVRVSYFIPDEKKSGGKYVDKIGTVRIFDSYTRELVFTDGTRVAVTDMIRLETVNRENPEIG